MDQKFHLKKMKMAMTQQNQEHSIKFFQMNITNSLKKMLMIKISNKTSKKVKKMIRERMEVLKMMKIMKMKEI